jgi:hypothetical protein
MYDFVDRLAHAVQQRAVTHELFAPGQQEWLATRAGATRFTVIDSRPDEVTISAGGETLTVEPLRLAMAVLDA